MDYDFEAWFLDNTDADFEEIVAAAKRYIAKKEAEGYLRGYQDGVARPYEDREYDL